MADDALRGDLANATDPAKGAALVGYVNRDVYSRLQDTLSIKDFGAIGDGTSRPLSSKFASLAAAQAVYPHATSLNQQLDWAAFQLAINTGKSRGGIAVHCVDQGHIWMMGSDKLTFGTAAKDISFDCRGSTIKFQRYGIGGNLFEANAPDGIVFRNLKLDGGMLGLDGNAPATGGQGFSFKTPKNCILDNISIVNTRGFQVLWYADRDNNQAYSNYLIDVRTDGASLTSAGLLFANLYASYMVRPYVRGVVKQPDTTGYAIDIKNRCVDCGVIDFLTEDCYLGMVISDDRSGIPEGEDLRGKGAQNTRITGTANRCKSAFSTNLAIGTTASIQAVSCGSASTEENIAAINIAGFNRFCNYDLHIREVHADAPVIRNGSEYQVFNIQFYDNSGTPLYLGLAGSYYSEINVMGGPNRSSGLFNMWSKITPFDIEDARTIPRYLDMRDVPSPTYASGVWRSALNFLLPGGSRGANQFSVRDNGNIYMQTLGTPRLSYRQSSNSWVFDNGVPAAADDTAAAAAGIPVNGIYQTGGVLKVRIT